MLDDFVDAVFPASCPGCGMRGHQSTVGVCAQCEAGVRPPPSVPPPPGIDWWVAAFAYEGAIREAIAGAKYRDHRAVLSWLAARLSDACPRDTAIDVVTWIPASPTRRRVRGVDHAEVLARHLARRCDLPVRRVLVRPSGPTQTGRPAFERRGGPRLVAVSSLASLSILVVDDVATTGGTASAAARALRHAGARSVGFASVARTPRHF